MTDGQLIGLICLLFGLIAFFAVLEWRRRTLRLYRNALPVIAVVEEVKERGGGEGGGTFYRTTISYDTHQGENITTKLNLVEERSWREEIRIVYDSEKPSRAILESDSHRWNPDGGILGFGARWILVLIFVIPGILLVLFPIGDPVCDDPTFRDTQLCD